LSNSEYKPKNNECIYDILKQKDNETKKPVMIIADEFHLFIDEKNPKVLRNFG